MRVGKPKTCSGLAVAVGVADAFGDGAGALPSDINEARVAGDLVEGREGALGVGEEVAIEIGFELEQGIINSEAVVLHPALQKHDEFLLTRQAFENLEKLRGR